MKLGTPNILGKVRYCHSYAEHLEYIIHRVLKNVPPMACYNFDTHKQILILLAVMLPIM